MNRKQDYALKIELRATSYLIQYLRAGHSPTATSEAAADWRLRLIVAVRAATANVDNLNMLIIIMVAIHKFRAWWLWGIDGFLSCLLASFAFPFPHLLARSSKDFAFIESPRVIFHPRDIFLGKQWWLSSFLVIVCLTKWDAPLAC